MFQNRPLATFAGFCLSLVAILIVPGIRAFAQETAPLAAKPAEPAQESVGFPRDAGPHDSTSSIEWWYFNSFLKTENGRDLAVVGSFFRVGLPGQRKGHYLIYSLTDLKLNRQEAHSVMDRQSYLLLRSLAQLQITAKPDDPRPYELLRLLNDDSLPEPHELLTENARVVAGERFSIAMENNSLSQVSTDGREWKAILNGSDWTLELNFSQPERPAMLVGGKGMTGIKRPNDMYYLSLTRMDVQGTISDDGVVRSVKGVGWLDRQWGSPEFVQNYGWDWLGIQMEDGSDMILYRIRDLETGNILKVEGTVLTRDGDTIVDNPSAFRRTGVWTDPQTRITFPSTFDVKLPKTGYDLKVEPIFPEQTIPVFGIGDAIWEGVVQVTGTDKNGNPVSGKGYLELVGYRKPLPKKPTKNATNR
ncbi:MAG: lipocalin-like domain-containing protein [Armatimonadaceae bacterium]